MTVKALTVWQPWASLIAAGLKQYETRAWSTRYRGPLAIHAAKRWGENQFYYVKHLKRQYPNRLEQHGLLVNDCAAKLCMPRGAVLCVARLVDVVEMTPDFIARLEAFERTVGDFSSGRFAWQLEIVEVFEEPVPTRGYQGLWEWERP